LIVVDEEHDQAYKQDEGAHYHARDMAVVRAHIAKIPIVLASATPSVESEVNARRAATSRVALPSRFGGQHMPHIEAIDLRREARAARAVSFRRGSRRKYKSAVETARAGAVVPQSSRLCAAHIMPRLRASLCLHDLRRLAGRSPLSQRLVCHHCGFSMPRRLPVRIARRRNLWSRSGPASSACRRKPLNCFECAHHGALKRS